MLDIVKIYTPDLEVGMHVSSLDRPWLETPFALQGFRLRNQDEIEQLRGFCKFVYVDCIKSAQEASILRRKVRNRPRLSTQEMFQDRKLKNYQDVASWEEEYPRAQSSVTALAEGIEAIFEDTAKGKALNVVAVKKAVEPMIDSISRNPDACIWLARMKQEDQYTYQHSLGSAIWAVALGRQLGLPKSDLRTLAIGGVLFDVGKLRVKPDLLKANRKLSDDEFTELRSHVQLGVDMIKESGLMNSDVIDMITHHHERHDGSGYPQGLSGDEIPIFARIASIVDCYDAITSHRSYARAIPPSTAIKMLYEWKDIDFQGELIEQFIQAVGIYPAGTLVELTTGEVGVVVAEYRTRRLRPKVRLLLDGEKQPFGEVKTIDLSTENNSSDGRRLDIASSLQPDAYGIDMTAITL
ncbi:MAG: HD-GYP domain-containing protein [Halioglobus sp.]